MRSVGNRGIPYTGWRFESFLSHHFFYIFDTGIARKKGLYQMSKFSSDFLWKSFEGPLRRVCRANKPAKVLEWGPGHSTETILSVCPESEILTIEHDPKYFEKAKKKFGPSKNVELVRKIISMKGGVSEGYINYPIWRNLKEHGKLTPEYDLIFVDGRSRFDCVTAASLLVKDDGVVVIHDTHRKNYLPATELFPHVVNFEKLRTIAMSKSPLEVFGGPPKPNTVMSDEDTLEDLRRRFVSGDPFFYMRFGDADLFFIDDPNFSKNRRHDPVPGLGKELKEAFMIEHPDYLVGCVANGKVFKRYDDKLRAIADNFHEGRTYCSAVAFHTMYVNEPEKFVSFVKECFQDKRVLLVGGHSICRNPLVRKVLNVTATIELTDRNAYQQLDKQMNRIEKNVPKFDIIISALGQATRVLAKRLWVAGHRDIQYFDVGSTVDALAERPLRSWIRRHADKVEFYKKAFMNE